jgi:hypothetical protein
VDGVSDAAWSRGACQEGVKIGLRLQETQNGDARTADVLSCEFAGMARVAGTDGFDNRGMFTTRSRRAQADAAHDDDDQRRD